MRSDNPYSGFYEAKTSRTLDLNGGNPTCNQGGLAIVQSYQKVVGRSAWMTTRGQYVGQDKEVVGVFMGGQGAKAGSIAYDEAISPTLRATASGSNQVPDVVCALDCRNMRGYEEICGTLQAKNEGGFSLNFINPIVYDQQRFGQYGNSGIGSSLKARDYKDATDLIVEKQERRYIVRRLTPLECCRLQGFPDWWEEGVEGSDSARYKMWGNGIALPCAVDVLGRIARAVEEEVQREQGRKDD